VPAAPTPSLLSTPPEPAPGDKPAPTPEQQAEAAKLAAEKAASDAAHKTRTDAWTAAATPEGKKAAYEALNAEEKKAAFAKLSEADRKALAIEDPAIPVYTDFKLPEGVTLDKPSMDAAQALFKEARLPQDQAQKFIDLAVSREQAAAHKGVQAFVELQNKWVSEIKADPDIGGDKLAASLATAARAIDRLGVPGLKEALDLTGAGNHPAVVKAFVRLGQMVSEDRFQPGNNAPPAAPRSPAEVIYGDSPKQSADA
jgi:hypothetical protein